MEKGETGSKNIAFCLLAIGNVAYKHHLEYAVSTLRSIGGWEGDVYILSDHPECFPGLCDERTHIINVNDPQVSVNSYVANPRLKRTRIRMTKTIILDLLPSHVEYVVYIDSDIITTKKNCVADFLQQNDVFTGWPKERAIALRWWDDDNELNNLDPGKFNVHAGSFILARGHSEKLLSTWDHRFKDSDVFDRTSLKLAIKELYFPNIYYDKMIEKWRSDELELSTLHSHLDTYIYKLKYGDDVLQEGVEPDEITTCFTHITSNRCSKYGPEFVNGILQTFVDQYHDDFCPDLNTFQGHVEQVFFRFGFSFSSCERKLRNDKNQVMSSSSTDSNKFQSTELMLVESFCFLALCLLGFFILHKLGRR